MFVFVGSTVVQTTFATTITYCKMYTKDWENIISQEACEGVFNKDLLCGGWVDFVVAVMSFGRLMSSIFLGFNKILMENLKKI